MSLNKDAKNLDASIAAEINICNIFEDEEVSIDFDKDDGTDWEGDYSFIVFNSSAKNSKLELPTAITVSASKMTLVINPKLQAIIPDNYYYEIFDTILKRVQFFGNLEIKK